FHVTGVQTCALPIYRQAQAQRPREAHPVGVVLEIGDRFEDRTTRVSPSVIEAGAAQIDEDLFGSAVRATQPLAPPTELELRAIRSEERRVGKECGAR